MTRSTKSNAKVAVITGSAGGLGNAIATCLAKDGFRVVLHDISEDNLKKAKAEFDKAGYESITVVGDVSKRDDQFRLVEEAVKAFGQVDVFVNNAGVESVEPFLEIEEKELRFAVMLESQERVEDETLDVLATGVRKFNREEA